MKQPSERMSAVLIWVTGTLALWLSANLCEGWLQPHHVALLYASAIVWCVGIAFIQGCFLPADLMPETRAVPWIAASLTVLTCCPRLVITLFDIWTDEYYRPYGFMPDMLAYMGVHGLVFFGLVLPTIAVVAATHGSRFASDRKWLRVLWLAILALGPSSVLLAGEQFIWAQH